MFGAKKEIKRISYLFDIGDSALECRYRDCQIWYIKKACMYKFIYYAGTLMAGACPIIVSGIQTYGNQSSPAKTNLIMYVFSSLASISVLVLNVMHTQIRWITYRQAAETLKRMRMDYLMKKLSKPDDKKLDMKFFKNIEEYMKYENIEWREKTSEDSENNGT